ncbi:MAG: hypothetical protein ACO3XO_07485 [Bdellovibrionota bacterium]
MSSLFPKDSDDIQEDWETAKQVAEQIGYLPGFFPRAVRSLIHDHQEASGVLRPVTKYQIAQLLKIESFRAMLYFAALQMRKDKLESQKAVTTGSLIDLFSPIDLASLIAAFVYYRRTRKILSHAQWEYIRDDFHTVAQVGSTLGVAIPALGISAGVLVGTMRVVGLAILVRDNEQGFKEYRRYLRKENLKYDFRKERELFECTSEQIALFALSKMGFGINIGQAFRDAYSDDRNLTLIENPLALRMALTRFWLDHLLFGNIAPILDIPKKFYPAQSQENLLLDEVQEVLDGRVGWISRGREDISESTTPLLFKKVEASEDFPEQLTDIFSLDQITEMEEEDFDDLIDHLDEEQEAQFRNDIEAVIE